MLSIVVCVALATAGDETAKQFAVDDLAEARATYRAERTAAASADDHLELARLCHKLGLVAERRAHLLAASEMESDRTRRGRHRAEAGDVRIGFEWMSPRELVAMATDIEERRAALQRHRDGLARLAGVLNRVASTDRERQETQKARAELMRFDEPQSDWLIGVTLADSEPSAARAAIDYLASRETVASSQMLARLAVFSQWSAVRGLATEVLQSRTPQHYVPVWMTLLHEPMSVRQVEIVDDDGHHLDTIFRLDSESIGNRKRAYVSTGLENTQEAYSNFSGHHSAGQRRVESGFGRAGNVRMAEYLNDQMAHLKSSDSERLRFILPSVTAASRASDEIRRQRRTGGTGLAVTEMSAADRVAMERQLKSRSKRILETVANVEQTNERILDALRETTWQDMEKDATAKTAWTWWHAFNGLAKPRTSREKELIEVSEADIERVQQLRFRASASCFAAGTSVWTDAGPVAIETVQTGDRVLSVDPATGDVGYSVVLYPTVRKAEAIYDLSVGAEELRASAGHPFWTAGGGWIPVKQMSAGMTLQSMSGPESLASIEQLGQDDPAVAQPVYNLVVDQSHNYFVGDSKVLVHDNTIPEPRDGKLFTFDSDDLAAVVQP